MFPFHGSGFFSNAEIVEIPTLRQIGIKSCAHENSVPLSDGALLCMHCRAIKDGEWKGGSLDARRFFMPHINGFYQPIEGVVRATSRLSIDDWKAAEAELQHEQRRSGR